jgi:hypothetical protein
MEIKLNLSNTEHKELVSYCNLNDLLVSEVVKKSFTTGFSIERYGLLSDGAEVVEKVVEKIVEKRVEIPVEVEKEVIKIEYVEVIKEVIREVEKIVEVPVEVIKEVEKIVYNEGEVVEVIREVPVEVIREVVVEKEPDNTKLKALEQTLHKLKTENIEKDKKIKELEQTINNIQFNQKNSATFLRGSNLNDKLF